MLTVFARRLLCQFLRRTAGRFTRSDPGEKSDSQADTIMHRAVLRRVEEVVRTAHQQDPGPGNGPPGRLFVPEEARASVLHWARASNLTCHLGVTRTMVFL
ncbi:hypothetical protein DPEC_G00043520 [Dallia pectoralis]|uniref:Uncharacterized protein n=1 Tax=Dallia pectoralis TaxID=75939 RepID=A0ACC2H9W0_DALPE|nr:hypothetical protein DPEC_G00043520 [Dallia pectoralis]